MNENDEFDMFEQRIKHAKIKELAKAEAAEFVDDFKDRLGGLSLRDVFEMGYKLGYIDGSSNAKHKP